MWDWKHPMTLILLVACIVLHFLNEQKRKEKADREASARQEGIVLEPPSWDITTNLDTGRRTGSCRALSSLPSNVSKDAFQDYLLACCSLPTPGAVLEKLRIYKCIPHKDASLNRVTHVEIVGVYQHYDADTTVTGLAYLEGDVQLSPFGEPMMFIPLERKPASETETSD
eukprot:c14297_g1_i3.p1 GENE.c14297_g1_i3~~c14297_g1_i3.p1  ORF type:complete len:194 (+),score=24.97 c14297_g1_i3:73-582(+)